MSQIHPQARTTPRAHAEIKTSESPLSELAERYNITAATARKWKMRETTEDLSHRPHKVSSTLTAMQEALVVELRRMLLLPLDYFNKRVYELARLGNHIMRPSIFDVENLT